MAELILLKQRLFEAEAALHRLMTGELEVTVSVGGFGATTYNQASADKLSAYVAKLKNDIAKREGGLRRGPILMRF
ncbi:MAG: hypothetical protein KAG66_12720 [Methylococcales bacterium]|nr:hypothetical protein [Methylococcales bacterium]